uniref:Uncharacterized protein n=1 Tax=Panagrellus redivivus TaxID=6233 RepID=A0A7E4VKZ5_PANRE
MPARITPCKCLRGDSLQSENAQPAFVETLRAVHQSIPLAILSRNDTKNVELRQSNGSTACSNNNEAKALFFTL